MGQGAMIYRPIGAFTVVASLVFSVTAAQAQTDPVIEGAIVQQGQIEELLKTQRQQAERNDEETDIAGEAGVYVLRVNDIFFVGASAGAGYADNPSRTATNQSGSGFANAALTAGVQTKLAGTVDFGLRAGVSGVEYFATDAPSSRSLAGNVAVGIPLGKSPLYVSVTAFGGFNYDKHFANGVSFYGGALVLGAGLPLGTKTIIRPAIGITRQWSAIAENDNTAAIASVSLAHAVTPRLQMGIDATVSRVRYDNFYEDITSVARNDWQYSVSADASVALTNWLSVSASIGYEKRDSSFFLSAYDGVESSVLLTARYRF